MLQKIKSFISKKIKFLRGKFAIKKLIFKWTWRNRRKKFNLISLYWKDMLYLKIKEYNDYLSAIIKKKGGKN
jgi:hypothetical protein